MAEILPYVFVVAFIAFFASQIVRGFKSGASGGKVCKSCGFAGAPNSTVRGSLIVEIILWLCLLVPGLIYSVWRASSRHDECPACGGQEIIPADSPIGRKIIEDLAHK